MTEFSRWDDRFGRNLRLRDLHVFMSVFEAGSMSKAASRLGVTQPSISRSINDLEMVLGVRLFDRSARGVAPTEYGNALVRCASVVWDELRQGIRSIEYLADPARGELRIGCVAGITSMTALTNSIQVFRQKYPNVLLHIDDVPSREFLFGALRDRKYDLGIIRRRQNATVDDDLQEAVLFDDRMVIVVGMNNPLARRQNVDLKDLVDKPWILARPDRSYYGDLVAMFVKRGLAMPEPSVVTMSVQLRNHLIVNGDYVAPFAEAMLPLINANGQIMKVLPISLPHRPWPVSILTIRNRTLIPITAHFIEGAREVSN